MAELRGLGAINGDLKAGGVQLLAVCVDAPEDSAQVVSRNDLPFPILSDAERTVIHAYGIVHENGGPDGADIAIPTYVLIDSTGRIRWKRSARQLQDRPAPEEVLSIVRERLR